MARYKYTQESGTTFKVNTSDKCDAIEDSNEVRQILDDLGELLNHSKFDDSYPKDATFGGEIDATRVTTKSAVATLTTGEAGFVKVSAAAGYSLTLPTAVGNKLTYIFVKTDDNANLITIDGHNAETINGSLTYAGLNSQYAYVAIRSDNANWYVLYSSTVAGVNTSGTPVDNDFAKFTDADTIEGRSYSEVRTDLGLVIGTNVQAFDNALTSISGLVYASASFIKLTANDTYAVRTLAQTLSDIGALANLLEDTTPELGGEMDCGAHSIGFTQQTVSYNVTTTTVDWKLGNKATMTFGAGNIGTFAFTNPTNPCNVVLKIIQDGTGSRVVTAWDADIKWVDGTAPTLSTAANAIDIISGYWDGTNYFCIASLAFS